MAKEQVSESLSILPKFPQLVSTGARFSTHLSHSQAHFPTTMLSQSPGVHPVSSKLEGLSRRYQSNVGDQIFLSLSYYFEDNKYTMY